MTRRPTRTTVISLLAFPLGRFLSGMKSFIALAIQIRREIPFREEEDMNCPRERKSNDEEFCFPIGNEKGNHDDIDEVHAQKESKKCVDQEQV